MVAEFFSKIKKRAKKTPKWLVVSGSASFGIFVFLVGTYSFYNLSYDDKIYPNTQIAGVTVGSLTKKEALEALDSSISEFKSASIRVVIEGEELNFSTQETTFDPEASVNEAFDLGRNGSLLSNLKAQLIALVTNNRLEVVYEIDQSKLSAFLEGLSLKFDEPEQLPTISWENGEVAIAKEKSGRRYDQEQLESAIRNSIANLSIPDSITLELETITPPATQAEVETLVPAIKRTIAQSLTLEYEDLSYTVESEQLATWLEVLPGSISKTTSVGFAPSGGGVSLGFNRDNIGSYARTIAEEVTKDPVDARLTIEEGKATVFQQSQDGWKLNEEATVDAIVKALESRRVAGIRTDQNEENVSDAVALAIEVISPTVNSSTIEDLGIKELIGRGETDFSGSPGNRVHNINTGVSYLRGLLVKPGEEFSTVTALGAVDASTGYLPELVIKENKTIPEYGGGLCQVSTTLFRSVLDAGLPVTERRNHSYRVSYYEREVGPGLDATVYLPKPDFKFKNDTPGWILVQGHVEGKRLVFELYGTSDGRESHLDGPHTLWTKAAPPAVYVDDSSLAPGQTKEIEHAHAGAKTTATYWVTRDGQEINRQVFESLYKALPAKILRGPGESAPVEESAAEPQPEETPQPTPEPTPTPTSTPTPTPTPTPSVSPSGT